MMIACMPLSKASMTKGSSLSGQVVGCVELSMPLAKASRTGEMSAPASRLAGRLLVALPKKACWSLAVNHFKKAMALSLLGDWLLTMNDDPAPPQIFKGLALVTGGGGITPYSRSGFMSLYTL